MFASCEAASTLGKQVLRFGFETCTHDCVGASITDLCLALHAIATAFRIHRRHGWSGPLGRRVMRTLLVNAGWSITGAIVWLQPGGHRFAGFDLLYKLNGQCQAMLLYSWWSLFTTMLGGTSARLSKQKLTALRLFGTLHALVFSLRALDCRFEDYVLCGGANVITPLTCMWCLVAWLCYRHGLLSSWLSDVNKPAHPLLIAMFSGFAFWIGNSAVVVGGTVGVTKWGHSLLERIALWLGLLEHASLWSGAFEEMATFHLFGLLGNEMLFRAYTWMTQVEAQAIPAAAAKRQHKSVSAENGKFATLCDLLLLEGEPWLDYALKRSGAAAA